MSDLKDYIKRRLANDAQYADGYHTGYEAFKTGLVLKSLRLNSGMTQKDLALRMNLSAAAVSRMEGSPADTQLSVLMRAAQLFGKKFTVSIE